MSHWGLPSRNHDRDSGDHFKTAIDVHCGDLDLYRATDRVPRRTLFLGTTALSQFWDRDDELLFLGPWCVRYDRQEDWRELRWRLLPNPWADRAALHRASEYCDRVCSTMLEGLTDCLNDVHGVRQSRRYWSLLIGPWLVQYTHALYDRYIHLDRALKTYPKLQTWCLSPVSFVTPRDSSDFVALYIGDFYNLQLYSQILQSLGQSFPVTPYDWKESRVEIETAAVGLHVRLRRLAGQRGRAWLASVLDQIARRRPVDIVLGDMSFDHRFVWQLMKATRFRACLIPKRLREGPNGWPVDKATRRGLISIAGRDDFSRILIESLPVNFPSLYLEGYRATRHRVLSRWRRLPGVIVSGIGWYHNESLKFLAAECVEQGSRLVGYQHGGGYGLWLRAGDGMEIENLDRWFSWGWSSETRAEKVINLPNPKLSSLGERDYFSYRGQKAGVLLVGTNSPMYPYWLLSIPLGDQFEEYVRWRTRFVKSLAAWTRQRLLVRLATQGYGWSQAARLREACPDVRFDDHSVRFLDRLRGVRLAVFDHPATTFLEAFAFNCPSILFWNPTHWECRSDAGPYIGMLRQAGILYDDPESAGRRVIEVYQDASSWWRSRAIQAVRRAFADHFALGRSGWVDEWVREIAASAEQRKAALGVPA